MKRPAIADSRAVDNSITIVDDFLSPQHCRQLLVESIRGEWVRSAVARDIGASVKASQGRRSESLVLSGYSAWGRKHLRAIERRLNAMFGIESRHLEPWQMTRYHRGDAYDYHLDCGAWARHPSGERNRTVLIVLERPARGGSLQFRALHQTIRPLIGRLVVWANLLPSGKGNYAMIHSARPVWRGRKTILTTWERQRPYF